MQQDELPSGVLGRPRQRLMFCLKEELSQLTTSTSHLVSLMSATVGISLLQKVLAGVEG